MNDKYLNDILAKQEYIQQNMPKKDPFDKGIMRAIKSAKESIEMDDDQSDRAIRNSLLSFGKAMSNEPKRRGFMANFAQVGKALAPALQTHDQYEDAAKSENKQMLQYAQNLRASEEAKMAALEQQAYSREHADAVLNQQKEHYKMMGDAAIAKANAKNNVGVYGKELAKSNIASLHEQKKFAIGAKIRYDVLKDFGEVLKTAKNRGLTGTDIFSDARRHYAKYITGDSKELTLNDMLKQVYISRTKELGGSNPSTVEVNLAFSTIGGVDKNYEASVVQINRDMQESLDVINRYNEFNEQMQNTNFQGMPDKIQFGKPRTKNTPVDTIGMFGGDDDYDDDYDADYDANNIDESSVGENKKTQEESYNPGAENLLKFFDPGTNKILEVPPSDVSEVLKQYPQLQRR